LVERRIKEARFPTVKSLDSFDFTAIPSLNKTLVLELARCEYIARRDNVIAVGNSGTGKTHVVLGLGLAACQKGLSVGFIPAAAMVHVNRGPGREATTPPAASAGGLQAADHRRTRLRAPVDHRRRTLVRVFSQRYERASTIVTSNLPFDEWTGVFGSPNIWGCHNA
jgi:DNA replication protein DnaC